MNISWGNGKSRRYTCGTREGPGVTRVVCERHPVLIIWCAPEQPPRRVAGPLFLLLWDATKELPAQVPARFSSGARFAPQCHQNATSIIIFWIMPLSLFQILKINKDDEKLERIWKFFGRSIVKLSQQRAVSWRNEGGYGAFASRCAACLYTCMY